MTSEPPKNEEYIMQLKSNMLENEEYFIGNIKQDNSEEKENKNIK